jgi:hypothetical protein
MSRRDLSQPSRLICRLLSVGISIQLTFQSISGALRVRRTGS